MSQDLNDLLSFLTLVVGLVGVVGYISYVEVFRNAIEERRRALEREVAAQERELLAALTAEDRAWLQAMGWKEPASLRRFYRPGLAVPSPYLPTIASAAVPTRAELNTLIDRLEPA